MYQNAQTTLIWLGEAGTGTDAAFHLVDEYLLANGEALVRSNRKHNEYDIDYLQSERKRFKFFPDDLADYLESERLWSKTIESWTDESKPKASATDGLVQACKWVRSSWDDESQNIAWEGIRNILERPWWRRCWIFQGTVASAYPVIHCRPRRISWDQVVLLSHAVFRTSKFLPRDIIPRANAHSGAVILSSVRNIHHRKEVLIPSHTRQKSQDDLEESSLGLAG